MRGLRLIVLGLLWSLHGLATTTAHALGPDTRRIHLKMESAVTPLEVRISPGIATLLLFDSALNREDTVLEGREYFREVDVGERTIVLLPLETTRDKGQFLLTVHFADGQAPATAIFVLKPHPASAEHQIEVYRRSSACETCLQQANEQKVALAQCREQLSRCSAAPHTPDSISELLSSAFIDQEGILVHRILTRPSSHESLEVLQIRSFRAKSRVAVEVLFLPKEVDSARPWIAKSATLVDRQGKSVETLTVRQSEHATASNEIHVWVETEVARVPNTYTLTLWDTEGMRPLTVDNVRFP